MAHLCSSNDVKFRSLRLSYSPKFIDTYNNSYHTDFTFSPSCQKTADLFWAHNARYSIDSEAQFNQVNKRNDESDFLQDRPQKKPIDPT